MKFALTTALIAAALALTGCKEYVYPKWAPNQERRQEIFQACLKALPAGPVSTKYNDWSEVVDSCASTAYNQSLYCYENCPPENTQTARLPK